MGRRSEGDFFLNIYNIFLTHVENGMYHEDNTIRLDERGIVPRPSEAREGVFRRFRKAVLLVRMNRAMCASICD